jgi:uncharacterized protein (DUF2236 family)
MGDIRVLPMAPTALILQVAHPVVGAGVAQHSTFLADPWGRLIRTLRSTARYIYGDEDEARAEAARLRRVHAAIRGVDDHGRSYRALDPDAYAWVHLTLFRAAVDGQARFAAPLSVAEQERLYAEWSTVGVRLGVRADRLPPDVGSFEKYFDAMVGERLEMSSSVRDVLDSTRAPRRPTRWVPGSAWQPIADRAGDYQLLVAAATLPPVLRERVGLAWTDADARRMDAFAAAVRRRVGALPPPLRYLPHVAPYVARAWWREHHPAPAA